MTLLAEVATGVAGLVCLALMFQRWFWGVAFGLGSLVSCLELLIGIAHFQIIRGLGYFLLMFVCWSIAKAIAEASPVQAVKIATEIRPSSGADAPDWSPH